MSSELTPAGRRQLVTRSASLVQRALKDANDLLSVPRRVNLAFPKHRDPLNFVAWLPDGERLITVSDASGAVRVWNRDDHEPTMERPAGGMLTSSIDVATDGTLALGDEMLAEVISFDLTSGRKLAAVSCGSSVETVAISPDRQSVAVSTRDDGIRVYTWPELEETFDVPRAEFGAPGVRDRGDDLHVAGWLWGDLVVKCGKSGFLVRRGRAFQIKSKFSSAIDALHVDAYGNICALAREGYTWWTQDKGMTDHPTLGNVDLSVTDARDGAVAARHANRNIRYRSATGEMLDFRGHFGTVNDIAISPDGEEIASVSDDGTLRVWDVHVGREVARLSTNVQPREVAIAPSGEYLATGGWADGVVALVDIATGDRLREWEADEGLGASPSLPTATGSSTRRTAASRSSTYGLTPSGSSTPPRP